MTETFDELRLEIIEKLVNNKITSFTYPGIGCTSVKGIEAAQSLEKLDLANNKIDDLTEIAQLSNLVFLNMENNYVTEIPEFHSWNKLSFLDLTGNCISSWSSVASVASLNSLQELNLNGNSLCTLDVDYRRKLFEMQSSLRVIDGWSREEFVSDASQVSSSDINESSSSNSSVLQGRITSLERKVEALSNAVELQEKAVSSQGPAVVRHTSALGAQLSTDGLLSLPAKEVRRGPEASVSVIEKELVDSFPYFRLLSTWRKKVLHLMMTNKFLESDLVKAHQAQKRERETLFAKVCEMERLYLSQKEQNRALVLENAELKSRSEAVDAQCAELQRAFNSVSGEHSRLVKQMAKVGSKLKKCKEREDQTAVEEALTAKHMLDRLVEYEARLRLSSERVALTASTLSYQQIKLRNDRAALEAERVQFQLQIARMKDRNAELKHKNRGCTSGSASTAAETATADPSEVIAQEQLRFLSDVQIDAEVEGTLKSIFQFLDEANSGLVSAQALLDLLLTPRMSPEYQSRDAFLNYLLDRLVTTGVDPLLASGDFFEPVGVELSQLMGSLTFARLVLALMCKVVDHSEAELTFGELLLLLMPDTNDTSRTHQAQVEYVNHRLSDAYVAQGVVRPQLLAGVKLSTDTRTPLTPEEMLKLQRAGLLGDQGWGVLPLVIPSVQAKTHTSCAPGAASASSSSGAVRSVSPTHRRDLSALQSSNKYPPSTNEHTIIPPPSQRQMQQDIERLSRERHHLLKMVQEMTRSLERRAEGIKWYFDAELKRAYCEVNNLHQQDRDSRQRIETLEERIKELQRVYAAFRETAELQNQSHSQEKADLMQRLAMRSTEEIRQCEAELQARTEQYQEIFEKNKRLNDEMTKLNLKIGTLQRQLTNERAKYEKRGKEVASQLTILRNQALEGQERCVKIDSESRLKLEQAAEFWGVEKQQLLTELEAKQQVIIAKNAEILALQQSVTELKAAATALAEKELVSTATNTAEETKLEVPQGFTPRSYGSVAPRAGSQSLNYFRAGPEQPLFEDQERMSKLYEDIRDAKEQLTSGRKNAAYEQVKLLFDKFQL